MVGKGGSVGKVGERVKSRESMEKYGKAEEGWVARESRGMEEIESIGRKQGRDVK